CTTARTKQGLSLISGRRNADNAGVEAARNPWPALGTLLVRDGAVTPEQLERALEEKRQSPTKRLGEILVEQGSTTRAQIGRILAEQHELEYIELDESKVQLDAAGLLPENLARRYQAVPVRFLDDGSILVAVADPTNVLFSDELRLALGVPVRVGVASSDAIDRAITHIHEDVHELEEVTEEDEPGDANPATNLDL